MEVATRFATDADDNAILADDNAILADVRSEGARGESRMTGVLPSE